MTVVLWGVLATALGLAMTWIAIRGGMARLERLPEEAREHPTPLQRVSRWSLGVGVLLLGAGVGLVWIVGPEETFASADTRITFTLILLSVLVALAAPTLWLKARSRTREDLLDERDRAVIGRAPAVQGAITILMVTAWSIALREGFNDAGAVPVYYLYPLFWSCIAVYLLGLPLGILIGYRRD